VLLFLNAVCLAEKQQTEGEVISSTFVKSTNKKQELPMVAIFVIGLGQ
jgi:hypothetical protein